FAWLDAAVRRHAEVELGLRALAALLATLGGADYPPRLERLERLYQAVRENDLGGGRTLGGCQLIPERAGVLVCREPAETAGPVGMTPAKAVLWDGRFRVEAATSCPAGVTVGALGSDRAALSPDALRRLRLLPGAVRSSLPALRDPQGLAEVPILGWAREAARSLGIAQITFRPSRSLGPLGFTVV
ncbi:MAG: tRNA lysidine(34) synthetase TilS, partial [Jatrophihabitantaceae bacterium]